ncbi:MAG TPA: lipoate--protein ligase [Bacteroidales bacterium]|jgi:lipoate-protein ligase A|nr:lipoate--protein ligase [Bacteroidales bacterium]HOL98743.1 lipoate--protein ligase [Bacteroidales bacterium]HOM36184.1 lipoate--protein ligase [Bacteroidales bacterium]HPD23500.1 lipoate--protein ligase [Bacteroidales bacterium]HRS99632.1 lipoate--protein ligase [Bacteroidales bacterium]
MYIIKSESRDAYFNLAMEEYLLKNSDEEFFLTAINGPSVLLGVNQNAYDEINALYVKQNGLKVVRRITGGGTVFQDEGILNFSFIYKNDGSDLLDFSYVASFIADFLKEKLGIDAKCEGRNDICINGKKFSGQARYFHEDRILHHGTILISTNKKSLVNALKFSDEKNYLRSIIPTNEVITNINEVLTNKIKTEDFWALLINYFQSKFPNNKFYQLSSNEIEKIKELVKTKYSTFEWNYGTRPDFNYYSALECFSGSIEMFIKLSPDSIIEDIRFFGDFFSMKDVKEIENALKNIKLSKKEIMKVLDNFDFDKYFYAIEKENFVNCIINLKSN